jgi:hypothetical protein
MAHQLRTLSIELRLPRQVAPVVRMDPSAQLSSELGIAASQSAADPWVSAVATLLNGLTQLMSQAGG